MEFHYLKRGKKDEKGTRNRHLSYFRKTEKIREAVHVQIKKELLGKHKKKEPHNQGDQKEDQSGRSQQGILAITYEGGVRPHE